MLPAARVRVTLDVPPADDFHGRIGIQQPDCL
jgi:hypothetical protein